MSRIVNSTALVLTGILMPAIAFADEHGASAGGGSWSSPLAIGIGMALAVIAAATAQGRIGAAFMEGVSRNPGAQKSMFVPLILSLAFVETLVLFTFLVVNGIAK